jgi:LysR family glycine cleavage system transcriptional activator
MASPSHLKSLQALELAMRTRSLKAAADILAITPAAVGQRVKALEDYLGLELVVRGRSGLQPTAALAAALPHLSAAFRELEAASAVLDLQRGHEIHVAATADFAELWLTPRLPAFRAEHPNIRFCVNGQGDAPLRLGPADCEIVFGAAADGGEPLFRDFVLPLASPDIAARIAPLVAARRLEGFPLLHLDFYRDDPTAMDWAQWSAAAGVARHAPERGIRFQRIVRAVDAVYADAGLTLCGVALIAEDIAAGRLALPFPRATGRWTSHAFQARFRPAPLMRPQMKRFRAWLLAEAERTAAWLEDFVGEPAGLRAQ